MAKEITLTFKEEIPALKLWAEWFSKDGDPLYASGPCEDLHCFFCGEFFVARDESAHAQDCIYVRAKALLEGLLERAQR